MSCDIGEVTERLENEPGGVVVKLSDFHAGGPGLKFLMDFQITMSSGE